MRSGLGPADSLLDFGCGTGETTIAMAQVRQLVNTASQNIYCNPNQCCLFMPMQ